MAPDENQISEQPTSPEDEVAKPSENQTELEHGTTEEDNIPFLQGTESPETLPPTRRSNRVVRKP